MVILNKTKPNMRNCQVIKSGFHDSFQDLGRIGFRKYGIPQSGAMDFWAYQWANWLVGNELNAPTIEMTFKGGSFLFLKNACIAFTGADMNIELDGQSIPNYQSIFIKKGSTIKCNYAQKGVRTYMAIKGICKKYKDSLSSTFFRRIEVTLLFKHSFTSTRNINSLVDKRINHSKKRWSMRVIFNKI